MKSQNDDRYLMWLAFLAILVLASFVKCQHQTKHTDTIEQQDEIRMMFVTVTEKKEDLVFFYRSGKRTIEVSMFFWDEQSVYKDKDAKPPYQFKGCFIALLCLKHSYLYWLQRSPCSDDTKGFYFKDI